MTQILYEQLIKVHLVKECRWDPGSDCFLDVILACSVNCSITGIVIINTHHFGSLWQQCTDFQTLFPNPWVHEDLFVFTSWSLVTDWGVNECVCMVPTVSLTSHPGCIPTWSSVFSGSALDPQDKAATEDIEMNEWMISCGETYCSIRYCIFGVVATYRHTFKVTFMYEQKSQSY